MDPKEFQALVDKVGAEAAQRIKTEIEAYETKMKEFATAVAKQNGGITEAQFQEYKKSAEAAVEAVKEIAEKQGTTLAEVALRLGNNPVGEKSISQVLKDDAEELRQIYNARNGVKNYMIQMNEKGQFVMRAIDLSKTNGQKAGPVTSISGVNGGGNVASIAQALDAATLLRVGAGAMINNQYRMTPWVFDLVNTISADFNSMQPFAMWFDEQVKDGSSATTTEGATKPPVQYKYQLNSATYKKEAALVGFSEEFQLDFAQLESNIMNVARIDVINRVNANILPDIISNATAYNSSASFKGDTAVPSANDFDAIAALAAQVDNATFGARANAAVMGTNKKYRIGIQKDTIGAYLNPPAVLQGISFVGSPIVETVAGGSADALIVGDFKQYNVILRGGLIVRVGYNGTDFAQNMYSVVLEQYYFNYISTVRKVAIVKGPDFATVKTAIGA